MCFNFHTETGVCSDLTLTNGDIVYNAGSPDNRPFGSIAIYSCNSGYTLTGRSIRVCLTGGRWSRSPTTCQGEFCNSYTVCVSNKCRGIGIGLTVAPPTTCSDLTSPTNGAIAYNMGTTSQRPEDTVATYTCNPGYTLNGDTTRTCGSDGMWSGSPPVCHRK